MSEVLQFLVPPLKLRQNSLIGQSYYKYHKPQFRQVMYSKLVMWLL